MVRIIAALAGSNAQQERIGIMQNVAEQQQRQHIKRQFEMQVKKMLGLEIRAKLSNHRYILHDAIQECERKAIVLATSWDYYEYHFYRGKWQADLLIVRRHNAVVPCCVLELETGIEHKPGRIPDIERKERIRRNREEVLLFVSLILIGVAGAEQELRAMDRRTQRYYTHLVGLYLQPKRGRPYVS